MARLSGAPPRIAPEEAIDRIMIADLVARYAYLLDYGPGRAADFADLFVEDGTLELPLQDQIHRGHAAIAMLATRAQDAERDLHHVTSNHVVDLDGTEASGHLHYNEFVLLPGQVHSYSQGHYEDDYCKQDGRWLFRRRRIFIPENAYRLMTSDAMQSAGVAVVQSFDAS